MNPDHLCMGCMSDKGAASTCPHCGWREDSEDESTIYLKPGTILNGKYLVGRVLGHGGFGITYLGWDKNLEIKLAIKEYLPRDLATRSQNKATVSIYTGEAKKHFKYGLEKFLEEGRALAKFESHPGVVSVRDFFEENGTAYLAMHYIEGFTFKEYLEKKGGKISFETALKIMMPVMDALREVHGVDLLHRDISPDNIYITKSGQVKLIDFGAARYAMGEHSRSLSIILKQGFAPEEQYRSKGRQGPWTDIYAVAATIYRAITGRIPPESLDRLDKDTLKPPSNLGADISSSSEKALMKALSVRAAERFQTIKEFQDALDRTSKPEPKPKPAPEPEQKYIQVNCPNCKTKNTVPEGTSLKEAKCKSCGSRLEKEAPPPPPRPPSLPETKKRKKYPWIIAAVAVIVLIIVMSVGREGVEETLNVTSNPSGAGLYFDGAYVADTPCDVKDISRGNHKVRVTKKKYKVYAETVYIAKGEKKRLRVELVPEPYGDLLIKSIPSGAEVYLEGDKKGSTPLTLERVEKGSKGVKAIKQGYEDWTGMVMVKAGRAVEIIAELKKRKGPVKGDIWRDPVTDMAFVWVPGGSFMMGSAAGEDDRGDDEGPVHEVYVDGFWMEKYEATNAQFAAFLNDKGMRGSKDKPWFETKSEDLYGQITGSVGSFRVESGYDDYPVVNVSWYGADAFAKWLSEKTSYKFRLPTEAEWEYTCRAASKTRFCFGDSDGTLGEYAWYGSNSSDRSHPVGRKKPNAWGLYDMHGNVWEWCEDWYEKDFYSKSSRDNPECEDSSSGCSVLRGGSWKDDPRVLRCAARVRCAPGGRIGDGGFRIVRQGVRNRAPSDTQEQVLEEVELASLRVTTNPAGARVYFNGKKKGVGPVNFDDLKPGEITVRAEHPGYKSTEKTVRLSPGKNYEVTLTLVSELFRFSVKTQPPDARVEFVGLDKKYAAGMELEPGKYRIAVSKPGYKPFEQWVELGLEDLTVPVELEKLLGKLTVGIKPKDARIRILNIKAKFEQGMELEPGRYRIEVAKQGYMTHEEWVALDKEDLTVSVELEKLYELKVSTKPEDADISILNSPRQYEPGIFMKPGEYKVRVSAPGYASEERHVDITNSEKAITEASIDGDFYFNKEKKSRKKIPDENWSISNVNLSNEEQIVLENLIKLARDDQWAEISHYAWDNSAQAEIILKAILQKSITSGPDFHILMRLSTQLKMVLK